MNQVLRCCALLLALGLADAALAQSTPDTSLCPPLPMAVSPQEMRAGLSAARDRGFLWRISRDGHTSYLYGTLHIAQRAWMFPGPLLERAIAASDIVALELDMLDPDIQRRLAVAMAADATATLPAALAARLRIQLDAACLAPAMMAALAPAVQLAALTTLAARWDGLDPAYAIDAFLAGHAREQGKAVVSLESPEMQVALLKGDGADAHEELDHALHQLETGRARPMLVRIAQVWDEGRSDELASYAQWCECADTAADRAQLRRLLDDRNPALADRIDAYHGSGKSVLAAVGALHLVGPQGLPALMAARGYEVELVVPRH